MNGGFRLTFDFYGDVQLDRTLSRFEDGIQDATPAWEQMADSFARGNARQFASGGAANSGGWSPLSPAYASWKAQNYPGQPLMVRTGALERSLTSRPFGIENILPGSMTVGTDLDYAGFHQRGDGNLPQRRVVELTERARREWVQFLQRHLTSER